MTSCSNSRIQRRLLLWVSWAAWFYTCLPLVSHTYLRLWMSGSAWVYTCLPLVSHTCLPHLSPTLVSHTCLPLLSPTLVSHSGFFGLSLHLSPTLVSHSGFLGSHVQYNWKFLHLFGVNAGIMFSIWSPSPHGMAPLSPRKKRSVMEARGFSLAFLKDTGRL